MSAKKTVRREQERASYSAAEAERLRKERLRKKQAAFNTLLAAGKKDLAFPVCSDTGRPARYRCLARAPGPPRPIRAEAPPANEDDIARAEGS